MGVTCGPADTAYYHGHSGQHAPGTCETLAPKGGRVKGRRDGPTSKQQRGTGLGFKDLRSMGLEQPCKLTLTAASKRDVGKEHQRYAVALLPIFTL